MMHFCSTVAYKTENAIAKHKAQLSEATENASAKREARGSKATE